MSDRVPASAQHRRDNKRHDAGQRDKRKKYRQGMRGCKAPIAPLSGRRPFKAGFNGAAALGGRVVERDRSTSFPVQGNQAIHHVPVVMGDLDCDRNQHHSNANESGSRQGAKRKPRARPMTGRSGQHRRRSDRKHPYCTSETGGSLPHAGLTTRVARPSCWSRTFPRLTVRRPGASRHPSPIAGRDRASTPRDSRRSLDLGDPCAHRRERACRRHWRIWAPAKSPW